VQAIVEKALGGVLLIDEACALARGDTQDFGEEAVATLVKLMEDHRDDRIGFQARWARLCHDMLGLRVTSRKADHGPMPHPWPLFDLRIRTPRLELRLPTDDDLLALMAIARAGLHDGPGTPFLVPWDELPSPAFERQFLQYWWRTRGSWSPADWSLGLVALADGRPVGIQHLMGRDFAHRRSVATGSWLGRDRQGRGFGTEMRAGVLWLAFEELGALAAESGYMDGNEASARVSEKLGYAANGEHLVASKGPPVTERLVRATRDGWRRDLVPVTVEGLDSSRGLFGERELGPGEWGTP
jgi:RimJ/RimL family protein N-acetyltransferase